MAKFKRGTATGESSEYRNAEKFKLYDRNEVYDDIMDKYIEKLHAMNSNE